MATPTSVTLKDRINNAGSSDLDDLNAEIIALGLDLGVPSDYHTWMKLGRAMNRASYAATGSVYYSGVNSGFYPDEGDLPS